MLTDGRIEQFWMSGCCVVTNISWNMLFNSNLNIHICGLTATLKFINQIALLEDRKHILMNRAKCTSSCKDGSNPSRIKTACNRERKLLGNQLARRSNPMKSNINWVFRRAKWADVIPKLSHSFVNGVNNNFLRINKFLIFKFAFILVVRTNLKSPEWKTLYQVNLPGHRSKSIPTQIQTGECRLSIYSSNESKRTAFNQYIQEW